MVNQIRPDRSFKLDKVTMLKQDTEFESAYVRRVDE